MHHNKGFSLIEILVVMVILATMITTATLGFSRGEAQRFVGEAENLQAWLNHISTEAILSSSTWGVLIQASQLEALVWDGSLWLPSLDIEPFIINEPFNLSFTSTKTIDPDNITPHYLMLPTGQIMPESTLNLSSSERAVNIIWPDAIEVTLEYTQ